MARGSEAKVAITKRICEIFPEAFENGKELRIPFMENGEEVQIKITLTAAKDNVSRDGETPVKTDVVAPATIETKTNEPTAEEKENIKKMLDALGL